MSSGDLAKAVSGDLVVTVPKTLWVEWMAEGDAVGEPETGEEWAYWVGTRPSIQKGDRLYVVAWGRLRGYAPVTRVVERDGRFAICRRGGAVACTVPAPIPGFRGYRRRWWQREDEVEFPDWRAAGVSR